MALTTYDEQAFYKDYQDNLAKNGARTGRSLHRLLSKGAGQSHIIQPLKFQITFTAQPTFTSGIALAAGQLVDGCYPICSVGVYKWQTDARKFYIGAYVWVAVTNAPTSLHTGGFTQPEIVYTQAGMNQLELEHHLCFEGLALRDVNYDQMMADG